MNAQNQQQTAQPVVYGIPVASSYYNSPYNPCYAPPANAQAQIVSIPQATTTTTAVSVEEGFNNDDFFEVIEILAHQDSDNAMNVPPQAMPVTAAPVATCMPVASANQVAAEAHFISAYTYAIPAEDDFVYCKDKDYAMNVEYEYGWIKSEKEKELAKDDFYDISYAGYEGIYAAPPDFGIVKEGDEKYYYAEDEKFEEFEIYDADLFGQEEITTAETGTPPSPPQEQTGLVGFGPSFLHSLEAPSDNKKHAKKHSNDDAIFRWHQKKVHKKPPAENKTVKKSTPSVPFMLPSFSMEGITNSLSARQQATAKRERERGKFKKAQSKWVSVTELFKGSSNNNNNNNQPNSNP